MKKTLIASLTLTPLLLITPYSKADAAHKVSLPALNKTTLTQLKNGTYKPAGKVTFAMPYKNAVKYTGKPSKEKLLRLGGMPGSDGQASLSAKYNVKNGNVSLYFEGPEKAKKELLKMSTMDANYEKSGVSDATIQKYIGKPSYTSNDTYNGTKTAGYKMKNGKSLSFEYKKVTRKSGNKSTQSWNVTRVSYTDFSVRSQWY